MHIRLEKVMSPPQRTDKYCSSSVKRGTYAPKFDDPGTLLLLEGWAPWLWGGRTLAVITVLLRGAQLGPAGGPPREGGGPLQELPVAPKPPREALV